MKNPLLALLIPVSLVVLVSCGFHLRGSGGTESLAESFFLDAKDPYGALTQMLRKSLVKNGTRLVENYYEAQLALDLSSERFSRRGVTTTSDISVAEYEIRLEVDLEFYRLAANAGVDHDVKADEHVEELPADRVNDSVDAETNKFLTLPKATLYAERVYSFDASSLVSNSEEEALLIKEMRQELSSQIIWRANKAFTMLVNKSP